MSEKLTNRSASNVRLKPLTSRKRAQSSLSNVEVNALMPKGTKRSAASSRRFGNTSIMTVAFAFSMVAFLLIALIATALPQFLAGSGTDGQNSSTQGDAVSEEQQLRDRLDENPDDATAIVRLADLLANTGRYEQAIRWYERAIEIRPDEAGLRVGFAGALKDAGYEFDAEVQLERALELDPNNVEEMFMLAETIAQDNPAREEEAQALYRQIIETSPDSYYAELAREKETEAGGDESD